jgi:hypothetical protein
MTCLSVTLTLGPSVQPVLKPKGFEDEDGHCLPVENRTDADADGRGRPIYHDFGLSVPGCRALKYPMSGRSRLIRFAKHMTNS